MNLCQSVADEKRPATDPFGSIPSNLLQILTEVGYMAAGCGWRQQAESIFNGIIAVRPESEFPWISYAIAKISVGQLSEAFEMLTKRALVLNPRNDLAKAFLGLILSRVGSHKISEHFLHQVVDENQTPEAVQLAKEVLNKRDKGWKMF
jgi:tetratricopeptide (TPR) repeat protein